jgi:hypothetical protein
MTPVFAVTERATLSEPVPAMVHELATVQPSTATPAAAMLPAFVAPWNLTTPPPPPPDCTWMTPPSRFWTPVRKPETSPVMDMVPALEASMIAVEPERSCRVAPATFVTVFITVLPLAVSVLPASFVALKIVALIISVALKWPALTAPWIATTPPVAVMLGLLIPLAH